MYDIIYAMEALEHRILAKRQELRDLLLYSMKQSPVFLPIIKDLRWDISVCDFALEQLYFQKKVALRS